MIRLLNCARTVGLHIYVDVHSEISTRTHTCTPDSLNDFELKCRFRREFTSKFNGLVRLQIVYREKIDLSVCNSK